MDSQPIRSIHCSDVIVGAMASQITSLTIVYSTVYTGSDQRKHRRSASLAFVRGIHRWPVNSPHKWPVTRKIFPFDDVIINVERVSISRRYRSIQLPTNDGFHYKDRYHGNSFTGKTVFLYWDGPLMSIARAKYTWHWGQIDVMAPQINGNLTPNSAW